MSFLSSSCFFLYSSPFGSSLRVRSAISRTIDDLEVAHHARIRQVHDPLRQRQHDAELRLLDVLDLGRARPWR